MSEWTLSSFHKKSYGINHNARAPDPALCSEEVWSKDRWPRCYQCTRPRGHGPEQAYCKQHDPAIAVARQAKTAAKQTADWEARRIEWRANSLFTALCKIADGDNDLRTTAAKAIEGLKRPAPHD